MGAVRRRRGVFLATLGLALGVWLAGAAVAWATGDSISATCTWAGHSQTCDSTEWYPSALTVTWQADPPADSAGCPLDIANHYDSNSVAQVSCSATWGQTTISQGYTLHIETSAPTASAAFTRAPDSNGWYNHPVTIAFAGSSFSGIASCTTATYAGPATPGTTVAGSCTDNAGKTVATSSAPFAYDATPPSLGASANSGDHYAFLNWTTASLAPVVGVQIVRRPGLHGKASSVVYQGGATSFKDGRVRNGVRYQYTLTATDAAGIASTQSITARPGVRLLAPVNGAVLTAPPLLLWTANRRATYYNVQLWRGHREVLSLWPARAGLQLPYKWSFRGHHYRLRPGTYRWYVWPGYGRRSAARYGPMIGTRTFVIERHA